MSRCMGRAASKLQVTAIRLNCSILPCRPRRITPGLKVLYVNKHNRTSHNRLQCNAALLGAYFTEVVEDGHALELLHLAMQTSEQHSRPQLLGCLIRESSRLEQDTLQCDAALHEAYLTEVVEDSHTLELLHLAVQTSERHPRPQFLEGLIHEFDLLACG